MTENSVQVFNNEDFGEIRALTIDSEPWFVAKDVCDALGLSNVTMALGRLDDDEFSSTEVTDTTGRKQQTKIVTEAGLYNLIMASKKPEARAFKRWVTHDVLPSIRKHGMYATTQTVEDMLNDPDTMIATLKALKAERQRTQALMEDNARMLPKSVAYDSIIDTEGTMTITQAARYLAQMDKTITRTRLFAYLRADGIICKQGNAPTKRAIQQGLARQIMSERADGKANDPYARLTQKGLDWCVSHYVRLPTQMMS
jgi:anti-repressor protein